MRFRNDFHFGVLGGCPTPLPAPFPSALEVLLLVLVELGVVRKDAKDGRARGAAAETS